MRPSILKMKKFILYPLLLALCLPLLFLFVGWPTQAPGVEYGMTFSRPYAESLSLNANEVLRIALDDVGIRRFRLSAYWGLLEPEQHRWNFEALDRDIAAIAQRNGKIVLALGEKLPRWPECWGPAWWKKLPREQQRPLTLAYLEAVVKKYRNNPTIIAWQVENEAHFRYGDCPVPDAAFIQNEMAFVRALDPTRPLLTTDSGELSLWSTSSASVDRLGVSVYRVVRNPLFGSLNIRYSWVPPYLYKRKATLLRPFGVKDIYVSEFQMEPWSNQSLVETPVEDQLRSMNLAQMRHNFWFAERMGISPIDFWGIEWWVWMKEKQQHPEFLEEARRFWNT